MIKVGSEYAEIIGRHTHSAPVDVAAVAHDMGLEIYSVELDEKISGVLLRDPSYKTVSGFVCLVSEDEPRTRQRFTAAHELGHFVLHRDQIGDRHEDNYLLRGKGLSSPIEIEANKFAADLLMPYLLIAHEIEQGCQTVEALAEKFRVSETAMSIRLGLPT